MPKKQKKILTRKSKTKNKNTVNVKINIDNSRKTTARRTPIKPSNMQPFVNFPTFQPARIQQLEPLKKYNNGDLTKVDDLYQKQFKTYLETTDKSIKDMIAKYDDTLKKNIAPQKTEESKPGASIDYTTNEGVTVLSVPLSKTSIGLGSQSKSDGFNNTSILNAEKDDGFHLNNLFGQPPVTVAVPLTTTGFIEGSTKAERTQTKIGIIKKEKEEVNDEKYNNYVIAYKKVYGENDNDYIDINSEKGKKYNWGNALHHLNKKIAKNLRIKKAEEAKLNFVSDYANYQTDITIKPLSQNPLYNKNMFVKGQN